jgi:eukaryotic-like serine/threonine-protein kinase
MATVAPPVFGTEPGIHSVMGRYKLLQKIGEGGCGAVWMAEQQAPLVRRVALKIIKLGMDTKEVVARFEAERQALALMDHLNIARVFDGGTTEAGRPFFVMELVRGVKITDYCDQHSLSTPERLALFIQVCHAVQHAHQKGIIHRDLKPSNILVMRHDGGAVPKVIDFGIAKAIQGRLTDSTLFTAFEQFLGTPAHMSPEQAEFSGLDVDTRSDIYSLGVLLYELLTGRPPLDPQSLVRSGLDEIRRMIREVEPARPSARVNTLGDVDQVTVARQRGSAPAQLCNLLRGDLDWIVMRCLEKDRTRRYETVAELAADIRRHLEHEPVIARPPTPWYLARKFMGRHRLAVTAGGVAISALLFGTTIATWSWLQERAAHARAVNAEAAQASLRAQAERAHETEIQERRRAEQNAAKAAVEARRSQQAFAFLASTLREIGAGDPRGRNTAVLREAIDRTLTRMPAELKDNPEVDGTVRGVLAAMYLDLGQLAKAEELVQESIARNSAILGPEHHDVAQAKVVLAAVRLSQRRVDEATALARESVTSLSEVSPGKHRYLAAAHAVLGACLEIQGKLAEAEHHLRVALELAGKDSATDRKVEETARKFLKSALEKQGRAKEAAEVILPKRDRNSP